MKWLTRFSGLQCRGQSEGLQRDVASYVSTDAVQALLATSRFGELSPAEEWLYRAHSAAVRAA
jgi:hypothetical protein